jgi:predicted ATPase
LRLLREAFERAREERELQLVTLIGVPGIGKSRLVYELSRIADADPGLVIWRQGRCLPYGDGVSFWALAEMVKAQAGILESDGPESVEAKLCAAVSGLVSAADADWVLRWLKPLIGRGGEERSQSALAESFPAWRRFLEGIADHEPAVLVFEDLHWADDGLLEFLDELVGWTSGVPLLVVCTARPELLAKRPGWGGGRTNSLTLSLPPLSAGETARLVHDLLQRAGFARRAPAGFARARGR